MAAKIKNYMPLLALASPPSAGSTILEWVPFPPGMSIGELIDKHNRECYAYYSEMGWDDELIEDLAYGITVVQDSLSNLTRLRRKTLADIDIVIIDLRSVSGLANELSQFAKKIAIRKRPLHVSQVAISPEAISALSHFSALPTVPSRPPILHSQSELESYLERFYSVYVMAVGCIQQARPPGGSIFGDRGDIAPDELRVFFWKSSQRRVMQNLASELRDVALMRGLTKKQMADLAQLAVAQESSLANLSRQIELKAGIRVRVTGFNPVRKPILQLYDQRYKRFPQLRTTRFLCYSLAGDASKLTPEQETTLARLGIYKDQTAVVHFRTRGTRDLLGKIAGELKIKEFKGDIFDL